MVLCTTGGLSTAKISKHFMFVIVIILIAAMQLSMWHYLIGFNINFISNLYLINRFWQQYNMTYNTSINFYDTLFCGFVLQESDSLQILVKISCLQL